MKNDRADWFIWSMNFGLGAICGGFIGFYLLMRTLGMEKLFTNAGSGGFTFGAALVGAGILSHYGDRIWFGPDNSALAIPRPRHSERSRFFSLLSGLLGVFMVLYAFFAS